MCTVSQELAAAALPVPGERKHLLHVSCFGMQAVLVDRQPPALVRRVLDAVCGACAEAAAGGRPGQASSARGSSPRPPSAGRKPVVDMQVITQTPQQLRSIRVILQLKPSPGRSVN